MLSDHSLLDKPAAREEHLLQLQIEELLNELKFDYDSLTVHSVLDTLKQLVASIPEQDVKYEIAADFLQSLKVTAQRPLRFCPPSSIETTGSFAARTLASPVNAAEVTLTIPEACIYNKDQLNHQYHARRAMYLLTVAHSLRKSAIFEDQQWEFDKGDPRKPVLVLKPKLEQSLPENFTVRVVTCAPSSVIKFEKLKPSRNNLRSVRDETKDDNKPCLLPTPNYNASILEDLIPNPLLHTLQRASSQFPNFLDAALLLKVWARQQGLHVSSCTCCGDLLTGFAANLGATGNLVPTMSSLQILKATLRSLADWKTFKSGIFMEPDEGTACLNPPPPLSFKACFEVLLVDPSGWLNLTRHWSQSFLEQLQQSAKLSYNLLDHLVSAEETFQGLFISKSPLPCLYDYSWKISLKPPSWPLLAADQPAWRRQERQVEKLVKRALGKRIGALQAFPRQLAVSASLKTPKLQQTSILIAAKVNSDAVTSAVDIGPAADSSQAQDFRQFWGSKSEMRRFQDGRICEAVAWQVGPSQRHTIPDLIVHHIMSTHMPGCSVHSFSSCLDWLLRQKGGSMDDQIVARRQADGAFTKLSKQLRSLSSLPLKIVAVQPISAHARQTSAFHPLPHPEAGGPRQRGGGVQRCIEPLEVLLQLEGSGRWSEKAEAFMKMKAAFCVQLAEDLFTDFGLRAEASETCVDVFTSGYVFRLLLFSERDEAMAKKDPQFAAVHRLRQCQASHHGLMLHIAAAHPSVRPAAQLASRWLSAQLLSNHVAQEALELITAAAYCSASPPASPLAGFMRFLSTVSRHAWKDRPLIIDPENILDIAARQAAAASFSKAKEDGFAPSLPLCTAADQGCGRWTPLKPCTQVVNRLVALAHRSLSILEDEMWGEGIVAGIDPYLTCLDPGLPDFDAVILLRRECIPNAHLALQLPSNQGCRLIDLMLTPAGFPDHQENLQPSKNSKAILRIVPPDIVQEWGSDRIARELLVGFEPVQHFVGLLEQRFGYLGLVFCDFEGGDVIAIKWHPQAFEAQPMLPDRAHISMPLMLRPGSLEPPNKKARVVKVPESMLTIPDMARIVMDIKEIGAGLVADVRLRIVPQP